MKKTIILILAVFAIQACNIQTNEPRATEKTIDMGIITSIDVIPGVISGNNYIPICTNIHMGNKSIVVKGCPILEIGTVLKAREWTATKPEYSRFNDIDAAYDMYGQIYVRYTP